LWCKTLPCLAEVGAIHTIRLATILLHSQSQLESLIFLVLLLLLLLVDEFLLVATTENPNTSSASLRRLFWSAPPDLTRRPTTSAMPTLEAARGEASPLRRLAGTRRRQAKALARTGAPAWARRRRSPLAISGKQGFVRTRGSWACSGLARGDEKIRYFQGELLKHFETLGPGNSFLINFYIINQGKALSSPVSSMLNH
jgi:hypothetical protein